MLRSAKSIHGSILEATDGRIGRADDFYFDDQSWKVRYLVADTGSWLPRRLILLSPTALGEPTDQALPVSLTREQIDHSPSLNANEPVSRQHERRIAAHYGWPPYWKGDDLVLGKEPDEPDECHLRSAREVYGYKIEASDGVIGHLHDLILETTDWTVRYIVVDLSAWLPDRKVLLDPGWFDRFEWAHGVASVNHRRDEIKHAPRYHPSEAINRVYEEQLFDYYGRPKYWESIRT